MFVLCLFCVCMRVCVFVYFSFCLILRPVSSCSASRLVPRPALSRVSSCPTCRLVPRPVLSRVPSCPTCRLVPRLVLSRVPSCPASRLVPRPVLSRVSSCPASRLVPRLVLSRVSSCPASHPVIFYRFHSCRSNPKTVLLLKEKIYELTALMKEDTSGDHLRVGVRLPNGDYERPMKKRIFTSR